MNKVKYDSKIVTYLCYVRCKRFVLGSQDITIHLNCSNDAVPFPRMGSKSQKQHITPIMCFISYLSHLLHCCTLAISRHVPVSGHDVVALFK